MALLHDKNRNNIAEIIVDNIEKQIAKDQIGLYEHELLVDKLRTLQGKKFTKRVQSLLPDGWVLKYDVNGYHADSPAGNSHFIVYHSQLENFDIETLNKNNAPYNDGAKQRIEKLKYWLDDSDNFSRLVEAFFKLDTLYYQLDDLVFDIGEHYDSYDFPVYYQVLNSLGIQSDVISMLMYKSNKKELGGPAQMQDGIISEGLTTTQEQDMVLDGGIEVPDVIRPNMEIMAKGGVAKVTRELTEEEKEVKKKLRLFKDVDSLDCLYCKRELPLTTKDFKLLNKHGWGCCEQCWELGLPESTGTIYPPEVLRAMHESKSKGSVPATDMPSLQFPEKLSDARDLKGDLKEPWMMHMNERFSIDTVNWAGNYPYILIDNITGAGVKKDPQKNYSYRYNSVENASKEAHKVWRREIRAAIDNGEFMSAINDGRMSAEAAIAILKHAKIAAPRELLKIAVEKMADGGPLRSVGQLKKGDKVTIIGEAIDDYDADAPAVKKYKKQLIELVNEVGTVEDVGYNNVRVKFGNKMVAVIRKYLMPLPDQQPFADNSFAKGGTIENTSMHPAIIAETAVHNYLDRSKKYKDNLPMRAFFVEELTPVLEARAGYLYQHNRDFKKNVNVKGNGGRDYLYMMMEHWAEALISKTKIPSLEQLHDSYKDVLGNDFENDDLQGMDYYHIISYMKSYDQEANKTSGQKPFFEKGMYGYFTLDPAKKRKRQQKYVDVAIPSGVFYAKVKPFNEGDEPNYVRVSPDQVGTFISGYIIYSPAHAKKHVRIIEKHQLETLLMNKDWEIVDKKDVPSKKEDGGLAGDIPVNSTIVFKRKKGLVEPRKIVNEKGVITHHDTNSEGKRIYGVEFEVKGKKRHTWINPDEIIGETYSRYPKNLSGKNHNLVRAKFSDPNDDESNQYSGYYNEAENKNTLANPYFDLATLRKYIKDQQKQGAMKNWKIEEEDEAGADGSKFLKITDASGYPYGNYSEEIDGKHYYQVLDNIGVYFEVKE